MENRKRKKMECEKKEKKGDIIFERIERPRKRRKQENGAKVESNEVSIPEIDPVASPPAHSSCLEIRYPAHSSPGRDCLIQLFAPRNHGFGPSTNASASAANENDSQDSVRLTISEALELIVSIMKGYLNP